MLGTEKFYAAFESHEYFSRFDWLSLKSQKLNERDSLTRKLNLIGWLLKIKFVNKAKKGRQFENLQKLQNGFVSRRFD